MRTVCAAYAAYIDMCRVQSANSVDWAYACLGYGELSEREGKTLLGQGMARVIQEDALAVLDDDARLAALMDRKALSQERLTSADWRPDPAVAMMSNPALFSHYMDAIREHGEIDARAAMQEEAIQWLRRHKDLQCIP